MFGLLGHREPTTPPNGVSTAEMPVPSTRGRGTDLPQSRLSVALCVLLIVVCLLLSVVLDTHDDLDKWIVGVSYPFVPHLMHVVLDGTIVACVAWILAEVGPLRSLLEDRLVSRTEGRARELIDSDFAKRATDEDYLRNFSVPLLADAEATIRRARFARKLPPEIERFLSNLQESSMKITLWREQFRAKLEYGDCPKFVGRAQIVSTLSWDYVNYGESPGPLKQGISEFPLNLPDVPMEQSYVVSELSIGGENRLPDLKAEWTNDGTRHKYNASVDVQITPGKKIPFKRKSTLVQPELLPWVLTFYTPVHGMTIEIEHPTNIVPTLYLFGLSDGTTQTDPVPYELDRRDYHRWQYGGWLMPDHGILVVFHDTVDAKRAGLIAASQPESKSEHAATR